MAPPDPIKDADARAFTHSRAYDLLCATPSILVYGFACGGDLLLIFREWPDAHDLRSVTTIANQLATLLFFAMQILLFLIRRLPLRKSEGLWPRATAILGANFNFALLLLPRVTLNEDWTVFAAALTIIGTLTSAAVLGFLGRSFSILPEARKLVAAGPYRVIRHPLYLAEFISMLGIMLQYRQPWAAAIALGTVVLQIRRMGFEEAVLRRNFPAYGAYQQSTARLIPGLY